MRFKLYALFIGVLVMAFLFGMPAAATQVCPPGEEWQQTGESCYQDCDWVWVPGQTVQDCGDHYGFDNQGSCVNYCKDHCELFPYDGGTCCDAHPQHRADKCSHTCQGYGCHNDYIPGHWEYQCEEVCVPVYGCVPVACPAIPCDPGYTCIDNQCVLEDPCADVQCLPGEVCEQGECVPVTCPAIPCDPGYYCDQGQCIPDGTCPVVPCPPGYHCIEGGCIEDICGEDFQCRPGYYCQDNECVIIPTGPSPFTDSFWSTTNGICWSLTEHGEIHLTVKDDEKFYVEVLSETILDGAAVFIHPGEEALCNSDATRVYYRPGCSEERQSGNYLVFSLSGTRAFQVNVIKEDGFDPRTVYVRVRNGKGDILYEDSFSGKSYEQTFSLVMDGSQCRLHGRTNWHIPEDMYRDGFFPYPY